MYQLVRPYFGLRNFVCMCALVLSGCSSIPLPTLFDGMDDDQDVVVMRDGHTVPIPSGYCSRPQLEKHDSVRSLIVFSGCPPIGSSDLGTIALTIATSRPSDGVVSPDAQRALISGHGATKVSVVDGLMVAKLQRDGISGNHGFWRAFEARDEYLMMASLFIPENAKMSDAQATRQLTRLLKSVSLAENVIIETSETRSEFGPVPRPPARP